ncbi:non-specific lipid transfer protein GPI-anchored 31-like [Zingiber officinale]|uniref:Bifunctional inhibitor/plant lipid transfer protein/seed storage helical domain-containing protein n=1 Tax=Zingiber officinale TaxID=94328 RepID=A0A8J5F120_ZINOF|nr:non-specific lipid transfer protein GPI-anchored 31-like [Zingiber officinale]KAG6479148.1 hypothetical protein ZIOFF_062609 [Zingiber officinale]
MSMTNFCSPPLLLLLLLCLAAVSTSPGDAAHHRHAAAPAPTAADCSSTLLSLSDCLSFVEEGSREPKPQKQCCTGLKKIVAEAAEAACLCDALGQGASLGLSLNVTKALALPSSCGISTPRLSQCKVVLAGVPAAAPAPSPSGPATAPSPFSGHPSAAAPLLSNAPVESLVGAIAICFYIYIHVAWTK